MSRNYTDSDVDKLLNGSSELNEKKARVDSATKLILGLLKRNITWKGEETVITVVGTGEVKSLEVWRMNKGPDKVFVRFRGDREAAYVFGGSAQPDFRYIPKLCQCLHEVLTLASKVNGVESDIDFILNQAKQ